MKKSKKQVHFPSVTGQLYRTFQHERIVHRSEVISFYKGNVPLANLNIQRLLKSKRAIRIKTGVYYFKKPDEFYDGLTLVDPLLVAGKAHPQGVIVYHSALRVIGNAYSESNLFQVGVPVREKPLPKSFDFQDGHYRFYHVDTSFGLESSVVENVRIRHFSKERILLEGLMHPDRFLGLSEFLQSIEGYSWVNVDALMDLLERYPVRTAAMRLGWLLDRFRERWHIKQEVLRSLEKHRGPSKVFLVTGKRKYNKLESRWNLMVPQAIYHINGPK